MQSLCSTWLWLAPGLAPISQVFQPALVFHEWQLIKSPLQRDVRQDIYGTAH